MRAFHPDKWLRMARSLKRDQRGSVLPVVAGTTLVLLGFASFAIDASYLYVLQNQLQASADAAALSAIRDLSTATTARIAAQTFAANNMPANTHGTVLADADVIVGQWNKTTRVFTAGATPYDAVRVTTRRAQVNGNAAPTFFASVLGINKADLTARATAAIVSGLRPWDIIIAQDVTSSFGNEIADARAADLAMLNCVHADTSGASLFGLALFTGVGTNYKPLEAMQTGYNATVTKINAMKVCNNAGMPACSGTNIAAGLNMATSMFVAVPPAAGVKRAIILVSDGEPNPTSLKPAAITAADNALANGISVFSVFYNRENTAGAYVFLASLARGEGIALATPIASQLPGLLQQICTDYAPGAYMLVN